MGGNVMEQIEYYKESSKILKAMGHPTRLKMVVIIMNSNECNQACLIRTLNIPQSTISLHLSRLEAEGIISCEHIGHNLYYKIKEDRVIKIIEELLKTGIESQHF